MIGLTGGLFMIWSKLSNPQEQVDNAAGTNSNGQQAQQILGTLFSLDTFIVNLADEGGKRYLRVTMDLELSDGSVEDELKQRLSQMRDSILMVLPSKHFADIRTMEGKIGLRKEIIANLNGLFGKESITNIYFTEFVIQ
jgi:flagellar FliL protein